MHGDGSKVDCEASGEAVSDALMIVNDDDDEVTEVNECVC